MIAGMVLAAGASRRMKEQKLLLPIAGRPLARHAVERLLAAGLTDVVVVLGREASAVALALADLPVRTAVNPRYAEGQSTSLRAGLDALPPGTEGVVIALGDQPGVEPAVVRRLVAAFRSGGRPIVVPVYQDGRGNPVLFGAALFDELRAVTGDQGGRAVIGRDPSRVVEVPVDGPSPRDIDTPEDYDAARGGG